VIHLPVEEVGLRNGFDLHLLLNPCRALPSHAFLLELVGETQALSIDEEGFFLRLAGVEAADE
jgi:hypothetical protein